MIKHTLNIFGVPSTHKDSRVILTGVPWEVTTSYGSGTSLGPKTILEASPQIDLHDIEVGNAYEKGYFLDPIDPFFLKNSRSLRLVAQKVIAEWNKRGELSAKHQPLLQKVNTGCNEMVTRVYSKTKAVLQESKIPGLIGGDHSTPLGAIRAVCEKYQGDVGILHIDAHADLRKAYQGFEHSHASIMRNVCELKVGPAKLVQVAIRDFCDEEFQFIKSRPRQISTYFDQHIKSELFKGTSWDSLCEKIVSELPQNVYVSFDIDGLSPEFCPHTGTPVPGGLSFDQATHLLSVLGRRRKTIVGFDLNEVAPGKNSDWDGNVGSRILFKLCGWAVTTNE